MVHRAPILRSIPNAEIAIPARPLIMFVIFVCGTAFATLLGRQDT